MAQNPFQGQEPAQSGTPGNPPSFVNPQQPYAQPGQPGYYPPQAPTDNPQPYAQQSYAQPGQPGYYPPQAPTDNSQPYAQQPYAQPSQPGQPGYYPPQANPQPYAQTPYAQPQKLKLAPGYLTAGIAGVIGFIAVFLPYFTISANSGPYSYSASASGSQVGGGLAFFDIAIPIVAVLVAAFALFGPSLFGSATAQGANNLVKSLNTQAKAWIIALIAIGAGGALLHVIFMLTNSSSVNSAGLAAYGVSVSWGFGAILYLLAMLAVVGGGIWELVRQK
jgi:hypothetical protein